MGDGQNHLELTYGERLAIFVDLQSRFVDGNYRMVQRKLSQTPSRLAHGLFYVSGTEAYILRTLLLYTQLLRAGKQGVPAVLKKTGT